jgi:hypothetical protein
MRVSILALKENVKQLSAARAIQPHIYPSIPIQEAKIIIEHLPYEAIIRSTEELSSLSKVFEVEIVGGDVHTNKVSVSEAVGLLNKWALLPMYQKLSILKRVSNQGEL